MKLQDPITLRQLLQYLDVDEEIIQISCYGDWDHYDEFFAHSPLLEAYLDKEIMCLGAVNENVIRITIELNDKKGESE